MNPALFRHRITFQKFVDGYNDNGFPVQEWQDVKKSWAMIKTLTAKEFYEGATTQQESNIRFVIRYTEGITNNMRISYKNRIFDIVAPPINDDEANKTLTILCKEVFS